MQKTEGIAVRVGIILALLGVLIAIAQLMQSQLASGSQDSAQNTQIAILSEQLLIQRQIATLQAGASGSSSTATAVAQRIAELQSTALALSTQQPKLSAGLPYSEDFEDGIADGFVVSGSICRVTVDENQNHVYEIDTSSSDNYAGASFGSANWKNYSLSYRVRLIDFSATNEAPMAVMSFGSNFVISLRPYYKTLSLERNWSALAIVDYALRKNEWITILLETYDVNMRVSINGKLVIDISDRNLNSGGLSVSTDPRTIVQFDDIQIKSLEQ